MQCGLKSQLAYIYRFVCAQLPSRLGKSRVTFLIRVNYYVCMFRICIFTTSVTERFRPRGPPGGRGRVQDGVLSSYMDAALVLLAHEGSEFWTNRLLLFTQVGLLQLQRD